MRRYASRSGGVVSSSSVRACVGALVAIACGVAVTARAADNLREPGTVQIAWRVVAYLPNRVFDLCDIARFHVRVGEGFGVGARATRSVPLFVGEYSALWVGLPGPRGRASVPLPLGLEAQKGVEVGPVSASSQSRAPVYGVGEVGAGGMAAVIGLDVGLDPYELADFLAGFVLVDFANDDF